MKIGIALVMLAVGFAVMLMLWSSSNGSGIASAAPAEIDLSPLIVRIDALEKQSAELQRRLDAAKLVAPAASARELAQGGASESLNSNVARLESEIAELRTKLDAPTRNDPNSALAPGKAKDAAKSVSDMTRTARDPLATEAERLEALRFLRGQQLSDGTDARMPVLADMIQLAQTSQNADTRADIWRQLNHITDPRLKQPLLDALAFDTDRKAREKAADTLADFMYAVVEAALRQALQNDASPDVKKQAAKSLAGH